MVPSRIVSVVGMVGLIFAMVRSQGEQVVLHYEIYEEIRAGRYIGNVRDDANLAHKYADTATLQKLRFQFLSQPATNFLIEDTTGVIKTSGRLDRDSICPNMEICEVKLDVAIQPVQYFEIIKVTVDILDINDNFPTFPQSKISHEVLESALPGNSFVIPTAVDPDSPEFGIQRYQLATGEDKFELKIANKVDGSLSVKLLLKEKFNREVQDTYHVQIVAFDGGTPPKSGSIDVTIIVLDSNDNPPIFENTTYEVTIMENVPIFTTIAHVSATDQDIGINGEVTYRFSTQTQETYGHLFGLEEESGDIFVQGTIDYEKASIYTLSVIAKDKGADSIPADATVVVTVQDVNDHPPDITVNTLSASQTSIAEISEDSEVGTFVAHITVVDRDSGRNGQFNCTLNDDEFILKQMYPTEYKIITARPLDREKQPQYNLALMCRDKGTEPQVSIKNIEVAVGDVNDCNPIFSEQSYRARLIENNFVGAVIAQVNATDKDAGFNSLVHYSLPPDVQSYFEIDPLNGVIKAKTSFDREKQQTMRFNVFAEDQGDPPRTSSAIMVVEILDVNDERPVFSQPTYSFAVPENEPSGTDVGVVAASDADDEPWNDFKYSFLPSRSDSDSFHIDPRTGKITTRSILDRETNSVYYLVVAASDDSTPAMSSTVSVSIYIEDKNDNGPIFDYPSKFNNTIHISNQVPVGYVVTRIQAHDMDIGKNAKIAYHFQRGNKDSVFSIDPSAGTISVNLELGEISYELYDLAIMAKDQGFPQKGAVGNLSIVVNKSIIFPIGESQNSILSGTNFTIVVSLACASGVITIILVTAIVLIKRQEKNKKVHKYNCRMEALKMLTAKESMQDYEQKSPTRQNNHFVEEKTKKEVSFSLEGNETRTIQKIPPPPTWSAPSSSTHPHSHPHSHPHPHQHPHSHGPTYSSLGPRPDRFVQPPHSGHRSLTLGQKELEVHQVLDMIGDGDGNDSTYSGDGSNTDSGRGASEEGEGRHAAQAAAAAAAAAGVPYPPPKPHYSSNSSGIPVPNGASTSNHVSVAPSAPSASSAYNYSIPPRLRTFGEPNARPGSRQSLGGDTIERDTRFVHANAQPVRVVMPSVMAGVSNGPVLHQRTTSPASAAAPVYGTVRANSSPASTGTYNSKNNSRNTSLTNVAAGGGGGGGVNTAYTGPETDIDTLTTAAQQQHKTDDGYHSNRSTASYHGDNNQTNPHFIDGVCSKDVIV